MSAPIFPKALVSWVDRIDQVDTIFAADPNSLAAEIIAIEQTMGTMPQVEGSAPVGNPVTYGSVSARISDTLLHKQLPYVSLYNSGFKVGYGTAPDDAVYNTYKSLYDPWSYFNGSDITIKASGLYLIDVYQAWAPFTSGYMQLALIINSNWVRGDMWKWNFGSTGAASKSHSQVNRYAGRNANTGFLYMGELNAGDRVRVTSENGTTLNPYPVVGASLKAYYLRSLANIGSAPGSDGKPG